MQGHQQQATEVWWREEVGKAEEIPGDRGGDRDRMAGIAYDPDAHALLARRAALPETLEEDVVPVPQQKGAGNEKRSDPWTRRNDPELREHEHQRPCDKRDAGEQRSVDHGRQHARSDAGDLEVESHMFRRLDFDPLAEVGAGR